MPDIKVKGYSGNDLVYQNVDKVYFRKSDDSGTVPFSYGNAVNKTVNLDFSSDENISVNIAEGELVKEMTIVKPADLAAENIRAGKEIAGFTGEFIGDTEEVTVDLNFVSGDTVAVLENLSFVSALHEEFGYSHSPDGQFALVVGDTYRVMWGSDEYTCVAMDGNAVMTGAVFIGNGTPFTLAGNGEPFAIGSIDGGLLIACLNDTEPTSHTVSMYHVTEEIADMVVTPSADGKVLSRVTIEKPVDLAAENILAGKEIGGIIGKLAVTSGVETVIAPDFTGDEDMVVTPADGTHFSKVTVEKPDTLTPENIAEGIDIAGIIGTLAAGGGEVKTFSQTINVSTWTYGGRISLDIGFVPDIIIVYLFGSLTLSSAYYGYAWIGASAATNLAVNSVVSGTSSKLVHDGSSYAIKDPAYSNAPISAADATGFNLGQRNLKTGTNYRCIAFGLT